MTNVISSWNWKTYLIIFVNNISHQRVESLSKKEWNKTNKDFLKFLLIVIGKAHNTDKGVIPLRKYEDIRERERERERENVFVCMGRKIDSDR